MTEKELREKYVDGIIEWVGMDRAKGTHKPIIDLYNSQKPLPRGYKVTYKDAYCATTTSAGAIKAGLQDIIPIECSCSKVIEIAKKMGIWEENDAYVPSMGDLILYDWDDDGKGDDTGAPEHIGAVVSVTNKIIKVVEGNKGGKVGYRELAVNGKYIRGFIKPNYASKATKKEDPKPATPAKPEAKKSVTEIANEVIAGKWGSGTDRKKKLTKAGYNYEKVQAKVNEILKKPATKTYDVGDVVTYTGKVHYPNAGKNATGKTCKGGKAKITQISKGSAHPYHLVAVKGSGATVYGWVNAGTFN